MIVGLVLSRVLGGDSGPELVAFIQLPAERDRTLLSEICVYEETKCEPVGCNKAGQTPMLTMCVATTGGVTQGGRSYGRDATV